VNGTSGCKINDNMLANSRVRSQVVDSQQIRNRVSQINLETKSSHSHRNPVSEPPPLVGRSGPVPVVAWAYYYDNLAYFFTRLRYLNDELPDVIPRSNNIPQFGKYSLSRVSAIEKGDSSGKASISNPVSEAANSLPS